MTSNEYTVKSTHRNTRPDYSQSCLIQPCDPARLSALFSCARLLIPAVDFLLASTRENSPKNYVMKKEGAAPFCLGNRSLQARLFSSLAYQAHFFFLREA